MPGSYYGTGIFLATLYCYPLDGTPRAFGFSVRCVQHLQKLPFLPAALTGHRLQ